MDFISMFWNDLCTWYYIIFNINVHYTNNDIYNNNLFERKEKKNLIQQIILII